ncbi:YihY/virulence factor BrkB family protein [Halobacteriovorax sp.]|uniref:YihY/virulence factor BrkB family protein n=1 Tax=Halobacteriovorax sp. TaxID=2020862 RepID=UPI00356AAFD0
MIKETYNLFKKSFLLFQQKRGTTLASSSTFYILLTVVPFFLLLIRVVGFFIGDINSTQLQIFNLVESFFPDVAPEILSQIQEIVKGPLFARGEFTIINFGILLVSSLSFFNSIWNGLYLITEDKSYLKLIKHLKGIFVIGVTIFSLTLFFFLPTIFYYSGQFFTSNIIVNFIAKNIPSLLKVSEYFSSYNYGISYIIKSNLFHGVIFTAFFAFLYRWFFSWKLSLKQSFIASLIFSFLIIAGKNLFWIYFIYIRDNLIKNYGDYYTLIVGIIWIYFSTIFFYFGACICTTLLEKKMFLKRIAT